MRGIDVICWNVCTGGVAIIGVEKVETACDPNVVVVQSCQDTIVVVGMATAGFEYMSKNRIRLVL